MYLVTDTETNGMFDYAKAADDPSQPRLAAITLIQADAGLNGQEAYTALIKPDGWTISPEITTINGLTTERCEEIGVPIREVLGRYTSLIESGLVLVGYNVQFDAKQIRGELRRAGMDDLFEKTKNICAMRACGPLKIEKAGAKKGGFPKLADAFRHFYGVEPTGQHTSQGDALACLMIARKLKEIGALPEGAVHHAKEGSKSFEALKARST